MVKRYKATWTIALWTMMTGNAFAQFFDAGSDGSFGSINIESGFQTVDVPPDGVFHATRVHVARGAVLDFNRNSLNTPVYILATDDIIIDGVVRVNGFGGTSNPPVGGAGGEGGFDGGQPGFGEDIPAGAGHGPGAGLGGARTSNEDGAGGAAYGSPVPDVLFTERDGQPYGSASLLPLVGGSGGGGSDGDPGIGGGGGGGAILFASNTRIAHQGTIQALGGQGGSLSGGSGGAIRFVAPIVSGNGSLDVRAGNGGGGGRVRIDTIDRSAMQVRAQGASLRVGGHMVIFPDVIPALDIIEVAGEPIREGQPEPVQIFLPFGAPATQTVTVQARAFSGSVDIAVVLTPASGEPRTYLSRIDMNAAETASVTLDVEVPINQVTRIHAWTR